LRITDKNDSRLGPILPVVECELNIIPNGAAAALDKKKAPPKKK